MADESVQPVPWVFCVSIFSRGEARDRRGRDQQVGRVRALRVPALDQHGLRADAEQRARLRAHLVFGGGERRRRAGRPPRAGSA